MHKIYKLGKESKLTTAESFQRVYKEARKFNYDGISVLVRENGLTSSRLGICIPKKQIPRAVDRNKIKRIIREYFRVKRNDLIVSLDMIFLVYSSLLERNDLEMRECLNFLWSKLIRFYNKV